MRRSPGSKSRLGGLPSTPSRSRNAPQAARASAHLSEDGGEDEQDQAAQGEGRDGGGGWGGGGGGGDGMEESLGVLSLYGHPIATVVAPRVLKEPVHFADGARTFPRKSEQTAEKADDNQQVPTAGGSLVKLFICSHVFEGSETFR